MSIHGTIALITGAGQGIVGRFPEDVATLISYLVGTGSDYMSGSAPLIDGGLIYR